MKVLIAFEFSEIVKEAFLKRGHDAHSCDYLPGEKGLPNHHQCDVLDILDDGWDLMIAHDPCTYQCNSGVRWLHERPARWELLKQSCELTRRILNAKIPKICRENPIPHKYAVKLIGANYTQLVQPHYFIGSVESKATCFWLIGLDELTRTQWINTSLVKQSVWRMPPGEDRSKDRSRFPVSIGNAMAEQWG